CLWSGFRRRRRRFLGAEISAASHVERRSQRPDAVRLMQAVRDRGPERSRSRCVRAVGIDFEVLHLLRDADGVEKGPGWSGAGEISAGAGTGERRHNAGEFRSWAHAGSEIRAEPTAESNDG